MRTRLKIVLSVVGLAVLGLAAPSAEAASIKLSDGVTTIQVGDNDFVPVAPNTDPDINLAAGAVTWTGIVGSWVVNVTTGLSKPVLGSSATPVMDLNSVNATSAAGGTLTIWFSDDNFGPSSLGVLSEIGGTTNGTVTYSAYQDVGNVLFAETALVTSQGPFSGGAFSDTTAGGLSSGAASYSLTQKAVITHSGAGASSFNAMLTVPDGGVTISLLGFALIGIEGFRRRVTQARR